MTKLIFALLLSWSWTASLSQGTAIKVYFIDLDIKRKVAVDLAELDMRRADAKTDSTTIAELTIAYTATANAQRKCEEAMTQKDGLLANKEMELGQTKGFLKTTRGKLKTQKVLKWVFLAAAVVVTIKSLDNK